MPAKQGNRCEWCGAREERTSEQTSGDSTTDDRATEHDVAVDISANTHAAAYSSGVKSDDALFIALPGDDVPLADAWHWWRIIDRRVAGRGTGADHIQPIISDDTACIAIAPVSAVAIARLSLPNVTDRQAEMAARLELGGAMIAPTDDTHIAVSQPDSDGIRDVGIVAHAHMAEWIACLEARHIAVDSIIPAASLVTLPQSLSGAATLAIRVQIGDQTVIASADGVFPDEPQLIAHLVQPDGQIEAALPGSFDTALIAACDAPPLDLRTGRWAVRRGAVIGAAVRRRAAWLGAVTLIVSLAIPVTTLARTYWEIARLDNAAAGAASRALGSEVEVDQASSRLTQRLADIGAADGGMASPIAALVRMLGHAPSVAVDQVAWRGDGILSVTVGATRADEINPVLIALQSGGYRITAQPRQGADGRALGDVTIRTAP